MTDSKALTIEQIKKSLPNLKDWFLVDNKIVKNYQFKDFVKAMKFINKVAIIAEKAGHHPDIVISYNKVSLTLSTHDVNGLSEKDFQLAEKIDKIKT